MVYVLSLEMFIPFVFRIESMRCCTHFCVLTPTWELKESSETADDLYRPLNSCYQKNTNTAGSFLNVPLK